MNKIILILFTCLVMYHNVQAQDNQKEINEIKMQPDKYLYAMGRSQKSAEDAYEIAKGQLAYEIETWLNETVGDNYSQYACKPKNNVSEITSKQRGKIMSSFLYVAKTDILVVKEGETMIMIPSSIPVKQASIPVEQAFAPTAYEQEMLEISNLDAINGYIFNGVENGKVSEYGKYDGNTKHSEKSYFFLIDKNGKVVAVLRQNESSIIDLSNGDIVTISDYGSCGVIWFQINENK